MLVKKRVVYLCAANPICCLWREWNLPGLDAAASLLGIEHDVLALLVNLIEAFVESLLRLMSGVKLPKTFYETMTIQTVLQP
jgi:hypothetical protein